MIINRIGVLSLGKLMAAVYGAMGLLFGAIFSLISLLGAAIGSASEAGGEAWFGLLFGVGAIIILPLFYGFFGFLGGLLTGALYNVAARVMGGLELEVSQSGSTG
jgi:hypothetical protein